MFHVNNIKLLIIVSSFLFILLFSSLGFIAIIYPRINTYEPLSVKIRSGNKYLFEQGLVKGTTPFGRCFEFEFSSYDSTFIVGYSFLQKIEINANKLKLDSSLQIVLRRGNQTFSYNSDSFIRSWHVDSSDREKYSYSNPINISHKKLFSALFSIIHWKLFTFHNLTSVYLNILHPIFKLPPLLLLLFPFFIPGCLFFLHKFKLLKINGSRAIFILKYSALSGLFFLGIAFLHVYDLNPGNQGFAKSLFLSMGMFFTFLSLIIFFLRSLFPVKPNLLLLISAITYFYFLSEIVLLVIINTDVISLQTDNNVVAFNKKPFSKNRISGYKYIEGAIRYKRCNNGEVVFDNRFIVNNMGYISGKDYHFKKERNTYRILVLGDSFTAGEYIQIPWPERLEKSLNVSNDSIKIEIYSFALGGIGLMNWYSQFFYEIIPNYDFDALIMAVFADNFDRDFFIGDCSNEYCYYCYNKEIVIDSNEFNNIPLTEKRAVILSDNDMNSLAPLLPAKYSSLNDFFFLSKVFDKIRNFESSLKEKKYYDNLEENNSTIVRQKYSSSDFRKRYGQDRWNCLSEIISYCKFNKKPMILCSVPLKDIILKNQKTGTLNILQKEMNFIADTFQLPYFDAYPIFQKLQQDTLNSYFLKNDGHWNQSGSDFFSNRILSFLKPNIQIANFLTENK